MKDLRNLVIGVLLGLLASGIIFITVSPPKGTPIILTPRPTESPLMVSVQGEILQPGVYTLYKDARLQDAIEKAGGLTANANNLSLNLAAPLKDGDSIVIPAISSSVDHSISAEDNVVIRRTNSLTGATTNCININSATTEELQTLPGIGPTRADAIIDYREKNGSFYKLEDLMQVSGIGDTTFDTLKSLIETNAFSGCK